MAGNFAITNIIIYRGARNVHAKRKDMMMKVLLVITAVLALEVSVADARYEYNERSELTRVMWNDEVMFGYEYDQIGNLKWACVGCKTNVYEVNSLNQYTTITDSDGNVHQLTYDEDGNLVQDFRRVYLWDSASRLMVCRPLPGRGGFAIRNHYDALGRRVKKETTFVAPFGTYPHERPICTTTYVYDGILPVLEEIKKDEGTVGRTEYVWGKDLSGTLDGAGGVGGLLYVKVDGVIYIPLYEAGGNVVAYVNASGQVVAKRAYSAFGQMFAHEGDQAIYNRLRIWFATKYCDPETELYYFGGRFYSPFLCRWLNRDPIGEQGGFNLYAFCRNDPINNYDKNGYAYFAKRALGGGEGGPVTFEGDLTAFNDWLDKKNLEFAHEQLFFQDGKSPSSVGYGKENLDGEGMKGYVVTRGGYDDCIMRIAVDKVKPPPYSLVGSPFNMKYNCQDYADSLRAKYNEIRHSKEVRCRCKKKGESIR